jgi:hypothetical protein
MATEFMDPLRRVLRELPPLKLDPPSITKIEMAGIFPERLAGSLAKLS